MKALPLLKILFGSTLIIVTLQGVYADCPAGTPSVCFGNDPDGYTGSAGADVITIPSGASVDDAISTLNGGDTITLDGGSVTNNNVNGDAIIAGGGADTIIINSGSILADRHGVRGQGGTDNITINGGSITGTNGRAINTGNGSDTITLNGGIITGNGFAINTNGGSDTVIIGANVIINGTIRAGTQNNDLGDILRFSMAVPENKLAAIEAEILAADPDDDSIVINGLTYTWDRFETLEANLSIIAPVPTLSEWSLFFLISLLGFLGFSFTRKSN